MNPTDDEAVIRGAYHDLARPTVLAADPVAAVDRRMRRRARRRRGVTAFLTASCVVLAVVGTLQFVHLPAPGAGGSAGGGGAGGAGGPAASGAVPGPGSNSCAVTYDRRTLREQDWAVDATVITIGRGTGAVSVRLDVNTWYRGGDDETLRVTLPSPGHQAEDASPSYQVGTRLLLSGVRTDRGGWLPWMCGFTRYYDADTADVWEKVFAR